MGAGGRAQGRESLHALSSLNINLTLDASLSLIQSNLI
jgi:hypothetical protein